jgi:hypothetical protein
VRENWDVAAGCHLYAQDEHSEFAGRNLYYVESSSSSKGGHV